MKKILPLILLSVLLILVACAPDGPGAFRPDARDQMTEVRNDMTDIRGINVRVSQIPVMILIDCDRTERVIQNEIGQYFPDFFVHTQLWRGLDLVPDDAPDFATLVDALAFPEIYTYYDLGTRTISISGSDCARTNVGSLTTGEQVAYSHEYANALQNVALDLRALLAVAAPTLERRMAANALAEGDATLTSELYIQTRDDAEEASAFSAPELLRSRFSDDMPAIFQRELLFPYVEGRAFAQALFEAGEATEDEIPEDVDEPAEGEPPLDPADFQTPWDVLNQAFASSDQPQSTEQILHPDRYLAGDAPLDVDLQDVTEVLGAVDIDTPGAATTVDTGGLAGAPATGLDAGEPADEEVDEDAAESDDTEADAEVTEVPVEELSIFDDDVWVIMQNETLGEFYLREYLATQLDEDAVDTAATGWGGDVFALFYNGVQDHHAWILRIAWDTEEDMAEFVAGYSTFADARQGASAEAQANGATCWQGADDVICMFDDTALLSPPPQPVRGQPRDANPFEMVVSYAPTLDEAVAMIDLQLAANQTTEEE